MDPVKIEKLDSFGRGIGYVNDRILFVPKALPNELVEVEITKSKRNFQEGRIQKVIVASERRVHAKCPFYDLCGGCDLQHITYEESVLWKSSSLSELFQRNGLWEKDILVTSSPSFWNYRNKITLKVKNGCIGFYSMETHNLVEIDACLITKPSINAVLKDFSLFSFQNGEVMIRANGNDEILMDFVTEDEVLIEKSFFTRHKIAGILKNHKCVYGSSFFYERMNGVLYQVSFDSFFQVNPVMSEKLFLYVRDCCKDARNVLDLYCGVGTLGLQLRNCEVLVVGIEVISNAVLNAIKNAKLNGMNNVSYHLGKVEDIIFKIPSSFDTIIVDPPRSGLDRKTIEILFTIPAKKMIYVSCNPSTLVRDLKQLQEYYKLDSVQAFDMFPYTKHVECVFVMSRR